VCRSCVSLLVLTVAFSPGRAEEWPGWRGPGGNGVSAETGLPLRWGPGHNVRWQTRLPGEGASSPAVWGRRVFVTAALDEGGRRVVLALDRDGGKVLWSREVRDDDPEGTSAVTGHAAATPATDGRRVVAAFGNAGVVCYDVDGKRLWRRRLGTFESELGLASSPVLAGDRVFLVCDHDGDRFTSFDSFLVALDAATGKDCWRSERRGLGRSWSTPVLVQGERGERELIASGQEAVRAYDPQTGRLLWQAPGLTGWVAPSPVFGRGLVFATSGKNGATLAVRLGGVKESERLAWRLGAAGPYVCSPVVYGDYLYLPHETGLLSCHEARTGKRCYRERLPGKFTASPVAGDGKVYWTNEDGVTFVIKAGPAFAVLARNRLGEPCLASPAVSGGLLFLRGERHLFCIGPEMDSPRRSGRRSFRRSVVRRPSSLNHARMRSAPGEPS
jgi:outer membrane protein assembly factor BamB